MLQTSPSRRPPLDDAEVREMAESINLLVAAARGAIDRGRFGVAEDALSQIGRYAGLLCRMGMPIEATSTPSPEQVTTAAADAAMREAAEVYRRQVAEINGDLVTPALHPDDVIALGPGALLPGDDVPAVCPVAAAEVLVGPGDYEIDNAAFVEAMCEVFAEKGTTRIRWTGFIMS